MRMLTLTILPLIVASIIAGECPSHKTLKLELKISAINNRELNYLRPDFRFDITLFPHSMNFR